MYHTSFEDEETGHMVVVDPNWEGGWSVKEIDGPRDAAFDTYEAACAFAKEIL